jgi:hypothetical protein
VLRVRLGFSVADAQHSVPAIEFFRTFPLQTGFYKNTGNLIKQHHAIDPKAGDGEFRSVLFHFELEGNGV